MLTPAEIHRYAETRYRDFLRAVVTGENFFPLDVRFGRPNPTDPLPALISEVQILIAGGKPARSRSYTVLCEPKQTRLYGEQSMPVRVFYAEEVDYLGALQKEREAAEFRRLLALSRSQCPSLEPLLAEHPQLLIEHAGDLEGLLAVCAWFVAHPRPDCYAREIPVAVHTKFIEQHQSILRRLLRHLLPNDYDSEADTFFGQIHLRDKETMLRVRLLDPALMVSTGIPLDDFMVPESRFNTLPFKNVGRVVVVENILPLLTMPMLPGTKDGDDVERYVILMCARQLLREVGRDFSDYWAMHREEIRLLEATLARAADFRVRLASAGDHEMPAFLDWFDERFLKRAKPHEVAS